MKPPSSTVASKHCAHPYIRLALSVIITTAFWESLIVNGDESKSFNPAIKSSEDSASIEQFKALMLRELKASFVKIGDSYFTVVSGYDSDGFSRVKANQVREYKDLHFEAGVSKLSRADDLNGIKTLASGQISFGVFRQYIKDTDLKGRVSIKPTKWEEGHLVGRFHGVLKKNSSKWEIETGSHPYTKPTVSELSDAGIETGKMEWK